MPNWIRHMRRVRGIRSVAVMVMLIGATVASVRPVRATDDALGFANATTWHAVDQGCFYDGSHAAIWNRCDDTLHSRKVLLSLTNLAPDTVTTPAFYATAADLGTGAGTLPKC